MNTNNRQNLQCVARGEGFVPVNEATYFIHQEPVHSGLFEMIGGSWQPVHNTDTSLFVRTCVNRDGLFRAIEDMDKPARAEKRYVGIFSAYQTSGERHPSMPYYPPMCPAYNSVRHFEAEAPRHVQGRAQPPHLHVDRRQRRRTRRRLSVAAP